MKSTCIQCGFTTDNEIEFLQHAEMHEIQNRIAFQLLQAFVQTEENMDVIDDHNNGVDNEILPILPDSLCIGTSSRVSTNVTHTTDNENAAAAIGSSKSVINDMNTNTSVDMNETSPSLNEPDEVSNRDNKRNHGERNIHFCPECKYSTSMSQHMKSHLESHRLHKGKMYVCNICGMAFSQKANMHRHQQRHKGIKPFACVFCKNEFFRKDQMQEHCMTHLKRGVLFHCPVRDCKITPIEYVQLTKHLSKDHVIAEGSPAQCEECPQKFTTHHRLARHYRTRHISSDMQNILSTLMANSAPSLSSAAPSRNVQPISINELVRLTNSSYTTSTSMLNTAVEARSVSTTSLNASITLSSSASPITSSGLPSTSSHHSSNTSSPWSAPQSLSQSPTELIDPIQIFSFSNSSILGTEPHKRKNCGATMRQKKIKVADILANVEAALKMTRSMSGLCADQSDFPVWLSSQEISSTSLDTIAIGNDVIKEDFIEIDCANSIEDVMNASDPIEHSIRLDSENLVKGEDRMYVDADKQVKINGTVNFSNLLEARDSIDIERLLRRGDSTNVELKKEKPRMIQDSVKMGDGGTVDEENRVPSLMQSEAIDDSLGGVDNVHMKCEHCGLIFLDQTLFLVHSGLHSESDPFRCKLCGLKCKGKYAFNTHIISFRHACPTL